MIKIKKREFDSPNISFKFPEGFYFIVRTDMIKFVSEKNDNRFGLVIIEISFSNSGNTSADVIGKYIDNGLVMRGDSVTVKRFRGEAMCVVFNILDYLELYTEIYDFPKNKYGHTQVSIRIYTLFDKHNKNTQSIKQILNMQSVKVFLKSVKYK